MRRKEYEADASLAVTLFDEAETMQLAGVVDGEPVLRTVHGVVDDGWVCFHAAPAGEKTGLVGQRVVVSVEQIVASVPSYFFDAERACPATTLFQSAEAKGVLTAIDEPSRKARVLQRLMQKLQPEGGHQPVDADSPLYRAAVKGLLIAGVPLVDVSAKAKLAQNKRDDVRQSLLEKLWKRGLPGDALAIERIREANPTTPAPDFLRAPAGFSLHCAPLDGWVEQVPALLRDEYWNTGVSDESLSIAHRQSSAWVGLVDATGQLVGTARAISDGRKDAWLYDVCVTPALRRSGLGQVLVKLLLDHPMVRECRRIRLGTRDAMSLYQRFGFVELRSLVRPYQTVEMIRLQCAPTWPEPLQPSPNTSPVSNSIPLR